MTLTGTAQWLMKSKNIGASIWMKILVASIVFVCFSNTALMTFECRASRPENIILDTDISSDVDDVGAVAILHALADKGEASILAMMVSSGDPWSAPFLEAVNIYMGRSKIPIGVVRDKSVVHLSKYTQKVAKEFHPNIKMTARGHEAVSLYRKILASQADQSVVIVSVGYLTNLKNLILSSPDEFSPLDGLSLVKCKVETLICMGGKYPSGREWNFYQDAAAAKHVVRFWPGPITFVGFETGVSILTGSILKKTPEPNPIKRSYALYNGLTNRSSWDQLTVLYAVKRDHHAFSQYWQVVAGKNIVKTEGSNRWIKTANPHHFYIKLNKPPDVYTSLIEDLMLSPIVKRSD